MGRREITQLEWNEAKSNAKVSLTINRMDMK